MKRGRGKGGKGREEMCGLEIGRCRGKRERG